ncbi:major facilitator superfamily permease [Klebsiella michiganensis]|uniref:Major facilitator superfamily permease n=1 Tax=Klebsiella michiganensis TaxID=1134687 RepID=A0A7H4MZR3_9ENTR|nr:major facilitator superfamily permease [Klebsiella michiganensis]
MLAGIGGVIADQRNLVSFSVLFGMSQNIGGLLGSAILGTFQTWREKFHSSQLADQLTTLNPLITERLQQYSQMYQSQIGDSTLLNVQATTLLQNAATLQANILAYNDTYLLTAGDFSRHAGMGFLALNKITYYRSYRAEGARREANKNFHSGVIMSQQDAAKQQANTRNNIRIVSIFYPPPPLASLAYWLFSTPGSCRRLPEKASLPITPTFAGKLRLSARRSTVISPRLRSRILIR